MLATISVTTAQAEDPPAGTETSTSQAPTTETTVATSASPSSTQSETTTTAPTGEGTATTGAPPEGTTTTEAAAPASATTVAAETSVELTSTSNPNQVDQDQTVVITATVVAGANTGDNTIVDNQPDQGGSQQPAEIDTGSASAVGSDDENVITQAAEVVLAEGARANVVQVALILNIGVALANSGGNIVGSTPGGSGVSGQIGTGDASATGLDIGQYITQAARENGDENTDASASQIAISLWMGVAGANSGTNVISGTGVAGSGGSVGSGNASATGNESHTEIEQYADILGVDQSTINVTQQATVLNVGFALSNTGLNDVSGVASGLLTASKTDDDSVAQELFAMLLPALLQSYGYGPAQGGINTGNATAVGNDSETFIRQVAMAASSGDGQVDIVQDVLVANMGAAAANTGGNTLGNVLTLDPETANAVVTMAAFMSELLAQVHHSANDTAFEARSVGIEIPFQGLILRLDGAFEGLDTEVEQGGTRANVRQVSIVVSLGIAMANSGGNITSTQSNQGNSVNGLQAGDALAVLAVDAEGNIIGTGDAAAGNNDIVVVSCQRINADDVDCLAPPTTTTPPTTTIPADTTPTTPDPGISATSSTTPTDPTAPTTPTGAGPSTNGPSGFGHVPNGTLPATGVDASVPLAIGTITVLLGGVILLMTRRRIYE
jgi:LPXTG-motif cell wall-anchored protein